MSREWTLTLRVVTPLVMTGADPRVAEWRAASIKGMVRWWFRIAGGSRQDEERLFGAVGKDGARSSLLTVETPPVSQKQTLNSLPALYFGFSIRMNQRGAIPAGETLQATFRVSPWADEADVARVRAAVWLAFYLGNFGTRSRKGYGSLVVTVSNDDDFQAVPQSEQDIVDTYEAQVARAVFPASCRIKDIWLVRHPWGDIEQKYKAMRKALGVPNKAYLGYPFHRNEPSDPAWPKRLASPLIIKPLREDVAVLTVIAVPDEVRQAFTGKRPPRFKEFGQGFNKFINQLNRKKIWSLEGKP